uniref:USP domain-containing protein n=1 Tax=Strongyloides papillosus TaxID=174720 RepID=A0A0N5C4V0_STREA
MKRAPQYMFVHIDRNSSSIFNDAAVEIERRKVYDFVGISYIICGAITYHNQHYTAYVSSEKSWVQLNDSLCSICSEFPQDQVVIAVFKKY